MKSLTIYATGDRQHGLGHVMRQRQLARVLAERGVPLMFVTTPKTAGWDVLAETGLPITEYLMQTIDGVGLIDVEHGPDAELLADFRARFQRVVTVTGHSFKLQAPQAILDYSDLVIRQTCETNGDYGHVRQGIEYVIINPEYAACVPDPAGPVVVCMGGADPHGLTQPALEALAGCGRPVQAFLGAAARMPEGRLPANAKVVRGESNLAPFFHGASLFVGALGMVAYEALAAGLPCVLYGWSQEHVDTALELARQRVGVSRGLWSEFNGDFLAVSVSVLHDHPEVWSDMSRRAKALVDGRGVYRVADEIVKVLR